MTAAQWRRIITVFQLLVCILFVTEKNTRAWPDNFGSGSAPKMLGSAERRWQLKILLLSSFILLFWNRCVSIFMVSVWKGQYWTIKFLWFKTSHFVTAIIRRTFTVHCWISLACELNMNITTINSLKISPFAIWLLFSCFLRCLNVCFASKGIVTQR